MPVDVRFLDLLLREAGDPGTGCAAAPPPSTLPSKKKWRLPEQEGSVGPP